jgi:hypothetical protein
LLVADDYDGKVEEVDDDDEEGAGQQVAAGEIAQGRVRVPAGVINQWQHAAAGLASKRGVY